MANSKDVVVTGVSTGSSRRADVHANDLEHQQGFNRHARFRARHLVVAGSGPGGPDGPPPHPRVAEIAAKTAATREDVQFLFFTETEAGTTAEVLRWSPIAKPPGTSIVKSKTLPI